jgi:hypothetical protein
MGQRLSTGPLPTGRQAVPTEGGAGRPALGSKVFLQRAKFRHEYCYQER